MKKPLDVPITVTHRSAAPGRTAAHEPITIGLPFPRGLVRDLSALAIVDEHERAIRFQATPAECWADGSVRWAHVDFQSAAAGAEPRTYRLRGTSDRGGATSPGPLRVDESAGALTVDTGAARFHLCAGGSAIVDEVSGDRVLFGRACGVLVLTDRDGREWPLRIRSVATERSGPVQCDVRLDGVAGPARDPLVDITVRIQFFAGSATTRVAVTLRNPRAAAHPGGFWELGSAGSVYLRDVSMTFAPSVAATAVRFAAEAHERPDIVDGPVSIYQDSSGGEQWNGETHVNRLGAIPMTTRGYVGSGASASTGLRATPCAILSDGASWAGLAVEQFWQNFPKALEAGRDGLVLRLWPHQTADLHELQGGEQKTHHFVLIAGDDPMSRDAAFWGRMPARASAPPAWYAAAAAIPHLGTRCADRDARYADLVSAAIEGPDSFAAKRERIDEYGWRHFGDVYADHENAFSAGGGTIVSHYNNQYDVIGGCATQFFRTGDVRWWELMDDAARHVADIDIYHTDRDKPAYNHGLFWHTFHYVPAGRSSHRSYPRHPKVWGGGPANEHNYVAGLRLHWLLTGSPISRDAALELAQWVIDMDDSRGTVLRWLSDAPTGLASATQSPDYHGPGRGAGHSIQALLEGHRLSGDARFLRKAEELIRRCIHPADDIGSRRLLEAELRWSYVVFLQSLGKYLDHKRELGENDAAAAYARASLLHYARWMAEHEYPYLQKPEILEYPTETWAAQDLRKADVFLYASQYVPGEERETLLERARYFFEESIETLRASATATLARPLVLLLSNGYMSAGPPMGRVATVTAGQDASPASFGAPAVFVRQKTAVKQRLLGAAAVFTAVLMVFVLAIYLSF